jgi:hypothetical protein
MADISLTKDKFLTQLKTNFTNFKKQNTALKIGEYLVEFGLTNKTLDTLKTKSKDELKKEALHFENPPLEKEGKAKNISNGSDGLSVSFVEFLEEAKETFRGSKFNRFVKKRIIKSVESLINKIEDKDKLEKLGTTGNVLICIIGVIDVFIDFKTLPKRFKAWKQRKVKHEHKQQNRQQQ